MKNQTSPKENLDVSQKKSSRTHLEDHHSLFFWRWAEWIVNARWVVIGICLFMVVGSIFLIVPDPKLPSSLSSLRHSLLGRPGLLVDTSVEAFSNPKDKAQLTLERYRDEFGRDDFFILMIEGDVFSLPFLKKLKALHQRLEQLNVEVNSLGERKLDRLKKIRGVSFVDQMTQKLKRASPSTTGQESLVDDLSDFGEEEGDEWGDEEGGTVIEEVSSLINARKTKASADGIVVGEWCDPMPTQEEMESFKKAVLADESLVGQVVGRRGEHTVILLRAHFMSEADSIKVNQAISEIAKGFNEEREETKEGRGGRFKVYSSGLPELNTTLKTSLFSTLQVLLLLSIVLMLSMLIFQFRHPLGVIPPMIVVAMSAMNTFAMMSLTGMPVTMLSNILPAFIFCVGIGDSVHLLSVYRDHFKEHQDSKLAVIETVATTGIPVLFTSLTTIVGLLSFRLASIPAIQDMGTAGAFGVAAACFHSLFFLPAMLTFNKKGTLGVKKIHSEKRGHASEKSGHPKRLDWLDRFIHICADANAGLSDTFTPIAETAKQRKRRILTLWVGLILTIIACVGVTQLRVWHNPISWLASDHPTKISFDTMDREIGGTANIQLLVTGGEKGIKDLELLKGLEALEEHIKAYRHPIEGDIIGNAVSVNDVVMETRRALHGGLQVEYRLPKTDTQLAQLLFLFENTGPDQLRRLASNDLKHSQMTIRLKWLEATSYRGLTEYIREGIQKYIPAHVTVEPTGSVYTLVSTVGALLLDLIRSFGAALFVITLIMILLLRGLKLGAISMIPNLMPIIWLMGLMGFTNIPVDMNNILIASISIGLAVDDTIHLLHHYRVYYESEPDPFSAISRALQHAGRAMVSTSFILTIGFFAYIASDMSNIRIFGLLIGLSAAIAMLVDLIFAPAILRTIYPRLSFNRVDFLNERKKSS